MPLLPRLSSLWRNLFHQQRSEQELKEEVDAYLEMLIEMKIQQGLNPAEARRAALIELGGVEQVKERVREVSLGHHLETMWQDLRHGLRLLRRSPGFTTVAVLSLALGIGANTAIFSVVNVLMLRPLPYRAPEQLVKVFQMQPDLAKGSLPSAWSYPRFEILRDQSQSFTAIAGFWQNSYNLTGTDTAERLQVEMVSASYFPMLGVEAAVGRTFAAEEDRTPETNLAALLSYGLWQRRFGGDAQVIGKSIELEKNAFMVVGVL